MEKFMKKLMIALMASLMVGFVCAQSVTSANIVGYKTLAISGGNLNMLAINWQKVQGGSISVQDVLGNKNGLIAATGGGSADNLLVYDPSTGYKDYWLYFSASPSFASWNGKWMDGSTGTPSLDTMAPGTAFWLQSSGTNTTVTTSGEVVQNGTKTISITGGQLNMIGNPFAADLPLNGPGAPTWIANGAQAATGGGSADNILIYDPSTGYKDYWLYFSASPSFASWNGKWMDGATGTPTSNTSVIPMGGGAWYQSIGGGNWTLTINKPY